MGEIKIFLPNFANLSFLYIFYMQSYQRYRSSGCGYIYIYIMKVINKYILQKETKN